MPANVTYTITETDTGHEDGYFVNEEFFSDTISPDAAKEGISYEANFVNTRNAGDLVIRKVLNGSAPHKDMQFAIRVTLQRSDDISPARTYVTSDGEQTFTDAGDGTAYLDILLRGDESLTIYDVLVDTDYTVTEADYADLAYTVELEGDSGTMTTEGAEAIITNIRNTSDITIIKTLNGNYTETGREFSYVITMTAENLNTAAYKRDYTCLRSNGSSEGEEETLTYDAEADQWTVKLVGGDELAILDVPAGVTYTITETDYGAADGYTVKQNVFTDTVVAGAEQDAYTAEFVNVRNAGTLSVTKLLDGTGTNADKAFEVTVTLKRSDNVSPARKYNTSAGTLTFTRNDDGSASATFSIKGNETLSIKGVLVDTEYSVVEADYTSEGYTTAYEGANGTMTAQGAQVNITNTRNAGSLTIRKTVEAIGVPDAETTRYTFNITLKDALGVGYTGTMDTVDQNGRNGSVTFVSGNATVQLAHGESITVLDILEGMSYAVTENRQAGVDTIEPDNASGTMGSGEIVLDYTNKLQAGTMRLTVLKVWKDENDLDELRPDEVIVTVTTRGQVVAELALNPGNGWTDETDELPRYDENGVAYVYNVSEAEVPDGYTAVYSVSGTTVTITNRHKVSPPGEGSIVIGDETLPLGAGVNMHEGYCFD